MKLNQRITLFSTVFLFVILVIVNSAVYIFFKQFMQESERNQIQEQGQAVLEIIGDHNRPSVLLDNYLIGEGMLRIVRPDGTVEKALAEDPSIIHVPPVYSERQYADIITFNDQEYAVSRQPLIWDDGTVMTLERVESITHYTNTLMLLQRVLIIASFFVLIPSFIAGQLLSRFILTPIRTLIRTMQEISTKGSFKKINVPSKQTDELAQMSVTFNHMIDLLQRNFDQQQQFVSDASHELKTPLTVIESYARLLKRWGMKDPAILDEAVEAIYSEALRMRGMTQQMLDLANGETETLQLEQAVNLTEVIKETAERMSRSFKRDIELTLSENVWVLGRDDKYKQLLFILLENGFKYSQDALRIELYIQKDKAMLEVADSGIGIPKESHSRIFERFFRVSEDRNRQSGGSGLGLAIAKKIVDDYTGSIYVKSAVGKGSTFVVSLPLHILKEEQT
ncbi:sensor histidine kinase [Alkalicoccobacillus porphyridii]|uniref:histidine kinase n=1 Tax=Alkalicoccobacillus porphyridii TaxID=2597270 RepID=A0A553ZTB8_9BACI|nr:HAMP domain-containing sensor histidine kinase [Alkalicoccobacillus porphyridii]TSB44710.1 HAMP domain-containing histidine kinase [Alkalicoccobacillus porphyridii]